MNMEKSDNHQVHHRRPKAARRQTALRRRLAVSLFCGTVVTWAWLSSRSRSSGSASTKWYDTIPDLDLQQLAPPMRAEALQRFNRDSVRVAASSRSRSAATPTQPAR